MTAMSAVRWRRARPARLWIALALCAPWLMGSDHEAASPHTPSPDGASLRIISPVDGAVVTSPVTVVFGLSGMGVAPAGVQHDKTGHHHLIIDAPLPDLRFAIPKDDRHRHFGGGQTQATIELPPGQHTLQLLLGDPRHLPHVPVVKSAVITIRVQ